ncbi:RagB/SusD family nutrient uptake outer membrane protein [Mangrovibacterium lignilyticum]|uniref:RagB/SusD family nutrient uptake outer membrane protein n=1 Tax=Mangrovibacterium lignilyticum TaxID=2668052 RepID=UPI0013CF8294|nr:RagB/SusD family nutrient uptake outer membrane protein [Mangrovibacterium lignilyticum]
MKIKIAYKTAFLLTLFLAVSCDESILDQTNPNQFTVDQYYKDADQLTAATNGIYSEFYGAALWGRMMQYFCDGRADEHVPGGGQLETHNRQLLEGTYDNGNYTISVVWRGLYRIIHRANAVIQFGPQIEEIDAAVQKQRIAEAKFLRSWAYFYLVVNWGKIPVYTEIAQSPGDAQPLSEESVVYQLLETDLTTIQSDLAWNYTGSDAGRASKGAAKLLLARVYMHQGKYSDARDVLEDIYQNGPYSLVANYSDNFMEETEYNDESIFEIGFAGTGFTWSEDGNSSNARSNVMFQDYSPVAWRNCIPSDKLMDDFERPYKGDAKEDPRLHETVYFSGDTFGPAESPIVLTDEMQNGNSSQFNGTTVKASWKKYSPMYKLDPGGYYTSNINYRNMRYAEVLIKLAECENEIGTQAKAIDYLNEIRARASVDMPAYPTANYPCDSYDQVMRAIMHESYVEFSDEKLRELELARWRKNNKFSTLNPDPIDYIVSDPSKAYLVYPNEETTANTNID